MNHHAKPLRSLLLAVALMFASPFVGQNLALLGVESAHAQSQRVVASVLFEGNQRFSDKQLLAMVGAASQGIYTPEGVRSDVETIRQAYNETGYVNVSVSAREEVVEGGRMRIVYVVNEGQRTGIAAINFTGNNSINAGTLKGVISTKETGILSWLLRDDLYSQDKLALDSELIRLYYANHGYPDAQVLSAIGEYDASRNAYFVNFTISEGERYNFGEIGIETSIAGLNTDALKGSIRTNRNQTYSLRDLQRSADDIGYRATMQGYSFADVRARIDRDMASRTFNITYLVDEGARAYVERINISGNVKTRDFVIRRELDFAEGDPFNRNLVTRGRTAIEALGFFSGVQVTAQQGSAADKVIINIAVTEKSTGDYGFTGGYATDRGFLGEISLTERNFLGRGQYLRIAVGASESDRSFDFSFTEPRFMGLKVSAGIDLYRRQTNENAFNYYGTNATGGQLRFGLPITEDINVSLFTGVEHKTFADVDAPFSSFVADGQELYKGFIGYTLTYDTVDDQRRPTEGIYGTFTQQYVGWDHSYLRSEVRARYFMTLNQDAGLVASLRGTAGVINDFSNNGVHPTEGFAMGSNLVRGFEGRGFGPRLLGTGESTGYTAYAGLSAELEFPIPVLPESYGLRGAVWADVGWVDGIPGSGLVIDPLSTDSNIRSSVGASIIWDSPFGPLRGDFAHVLNKATTDRTQVFQLTLSTLL